MRFSYLRGMLHFCAVLHTDCQARSKFRPAPEPTAVGSPDNATPPMACSTSKFPKTTHTLTVRIREPSLERRRCFQYLILIFSLTSCSMHASINHPEPENKWCCRGRTGFRPASLATTHAKSWRPHAEHRVGGNHASFVSNACHKLRFRSNTATKVAPTGGEEPPTEDRPKSQCPQA